MSSLKPSTQSFDQIAHALLISGASRHPVVPSTPSRPSRGESLPRWTSPRTSGARTQTMSCSPAARPRLGPMAPAGARRRPGPCCRRPPAARRPPGAARSQLLGRPTPRTDRAAIAPAALRPGTAVPFPPSTSAAAPASHSAKPPSAAPPSHVPPSIAPPSAVPPSAAPPFAAPLFDAPPFAAPPSAVPPSAAPAAVSHLEPASAVLACPHLPARRRCWQLPRQRLRCCWMPSDFAC
mmetsp:Transcript_150568/g.419634  ORF Transcript_150568/g.419634 Transcript_150568/m.419634 type:complete len:237 (-) Transcript_150568:866-1576(-)